jgi:hypothetical protein
MFALLHSLVATVVPRLVRNGYYSSEGTPFAKWPMMLFQQHVLDVGPTRASLDSSFMLGSESVANPDATALVHSGGSDLVCMHAETTFPPLRLR